MLIVDLLGRLHITVQSLFVLVSEKNTKEEMAVIMELYVLYWWVYSLYGWLTHKFIQVRKKYERMENMNEWKTWTTYGVKFFP